MKKGITLPLTFVSLMWIIHTVQFFYLLDLSELGIHPKDIHTISGIFTAPLIHGSWDHLLSNTLPLMILGIILFVSYEKLALRVWILNYLLTGLMVWMFARDNSYHIGASGIIYGLASFLLFSGFFRMDIKAIAIASGVAIFYGGMVWGVLPLQSGVSWESHLFGGFTGFLLAFIYRNKYKDSLLQQHENEVVERRTFDDFLNS